MQRPILRVKFAAMKYLFYVSILLGCIACQPAQNFRQNLPSTQLLDSLMPFMAKRPDSSASVSRFDTCFKSYYLQQKQEKQYQFTHAFKAKNGYEYLMVKRLEPSLKHNKFSAVCVRFKRLSSGQLDLKSYEELFWTWKMLPEQLLEKSDVLFTHNIGSWGEFYGTNEEASITMVLNFQADINKILRTLEFNSIVRTDGKVIDRSKTITAFKITTEYQSTNKVAFSADRIKRKFDKWRVKIPRNQLSVSQQDRLRSTHFVVTLYFDNLENKQIICNRLMSYYDFQMF